MKYFFKTEILDEMEAGTLLLDIQPKNLMDYEFTQKFHLPSG